MGTMAISLTSTYAGYLIIKNKPERCEKLEGTTFPCLIFFTISYLIGAIFMNIYGVATEAILQCFILDK
jgi:hypothetical protein